MAKKTHKPQVEMFDVNDLKRHSRKEAAKFPPIENWELFKLKKIWARSLAEARHPHRIPPPYADPDPEIARGSLRHQAIRAHKPRLENPEATRQSQDYWASYRKCAACPGPNRRQSKFALGAGPNAGHTPDGEPT